MIVNNMELKKIVKKEFSNSDIKLEPSLELTNNNFIDVVNKLSQEYKEGFISYRFLQYNNDSEFAFSCCLAYFNNNYQINTFAYSLGQLEKSFFIDNKFIKNLDQLDLFLNQFHFGNIDYRLSINDYNIEKYFYPNKYKSKNLSVIKDSIKLYPEYTAFYYLLSKIKNN